MAKPAEAKKAEPVAPATEQTVPKPPWRVEKAAPAARPLQVRPPQARLVVPPLRPRPPSGPPPPPQGPPRALSPPQPPGPPGPAAQQGRPGAPPLRPPGEPSSSSRPPQAAAPETTTAASRAPKSAELEAKLLSLRRVLLTLQRLAGDADYVCRDLARSLYPPQSRVCRDDPYAD